ncbi:L,D-transpeptidase family protein [Conexibacter sp. SYSU D00693]|uniref:L,D-transpeptidase family protein n=1 Tax=Conexibacter sp. SYSU D00693 TaxID=2812560 RepID=UPI00196AD2D0|nr:L,D-transpeptidase family protein [Conexibacter sp. SYSU D00693]
MARRTVLLLSTVAAGLSLAGPAHGAADPTNVPAGVSAGGVDLSGLTLPQAEQKLATALAMRFERPVVLGVAGRLFKLAPADARFSFDALTTAKRALRATKPGEVPLKVSHSKVAVREWVAGVESKVDKPARNATLRITLRKMVVRRAKHGRTIPQRATADAISKLLDDQSAPRSLRQKLVKVSPAVSVADLRRQKGTVITIDKANFKLRLFKRLKFSKSYGVATGQPAYPTPSGLFSITNKQVNPVWSVPNSPWAGELQGTTVAGGSAANPLKARWMGIVNGVGIHGTGEEGSIGSRASHGCLRMRVADVIDLYPRVPVGTPVLIR